MVIIETYKFKTFEEYLKSLSKPSRKNYQYAIKHNPYTFKTRTEFIDDPVNLNWIQWWMNLWGTQIIRGEIRPFAFRADAIKGKNIVIFYCFEKEKEYVRAVQFVEIIDSYMNCHPVMYDKTKYAKQYLSKFMWFNLVKWAIENGIKIVDLGGGNDDSWREMIKTRDKYPNPAYKWMYVPKEVKEQPDKQQNYRVEHDGISKRIFKID